MGIIELLRSSFRISSRSLWIHVMSPGNLTPKFNGTSVHRPQQHQVMLFCIIFSLRSSKRSLDTVQDGSRRANELDCANNLSRAETCLINDAPPQGDGFRRGKDHAQNHHLGAPLPIPRPRATLANGQAHLRRSRQVQRVVMP